MDQTELYGLDPIQTTHLFAELDEQLLDVLRSLTAEEWERPTLARAWNVRQVTAHLLDTALRRLSFVRDGWAPPPPAVRGHADLVALIDDANARGVQFLGRLSPAVLISLTEVTTRELASYFLSLDPDATAPYSVSWAGEEESRNWFDVARELTERWHHQQQIRVAVERPGIMTRRLYFPVLDCFMRALPHTYRTVSAADGDLVQVVVSGECGGTWQLERLAGAWQLSETVAPERIVARTTIPQDIAWRIFTKGIDHASALQRTTIEGDSQLGLTVLEMIGIVG